MELIETIELTASAASIEFTSIPQDGVDLLLKVASRTDEAVSQSNNMLMSFNSSTSNFSGRYLFGGGPAGTTVATGTDTREAGAYTGSGATANTFSNVQIYVANYTSDSAKSWSVDSTAENNGSAFGIYIDAKLWNSTNSITSLGITATAGNFQIGSVASLYKIS